MTDGGRSSDRLLVPLAKSLAADVTVPGLTRRQEDYGWVN